MNKTYYVDVYDLKEQINIIHMMDDSIALTPRESEMMDGLYDLLEAILDVEKYDAVILEQPDDWIEQEEASHKR